MKKLLLIPLLLVIALIGAILAFNAGVFHSYLEKKISATLGSPVRLGATRLDFSWPLTLRLGSSHLNAAGADVTWDGLSVTVASVTPPYDVRLFLQHPVIQWQPAPAANRAGPSTSSSTSGSSPRFGVPMRLALTLQDGEVRSPAATLTNLQLTFSQRLLLVSPAALHLKGQVKTSAFPVALPVQVDTDTLTLTPQEVKSSDLKVALLGLQAKAQGSSLLNEDRHRWVADIDASDLSRVPRPPQLTQVQSLSGALKLHMEVAKISPKEGWQAKGVIEAQKTKIGLALHQDGVTVEGPIALDLTGGFSYQNQQPSVSDLKGQLDLSQARILYKDLFAKASGGDLRLTVAADSDAHQLTLKSLSLKALQIQAAATGRVQLSSPYAGDLNVSIPLVDLSGLEKNILPLKTSPMRGKIAAQAHVVGPLTDPSKARVEISSLKIQGFSAQADFAKPGVFHVKGPVRAGLDAKLMYASGKVTSARAQGQVDLKGLAIAAGPFRKPAGSLFAGSFLISNAGTNLSINRLNLVTAFGQFGVKGTVKDPFKPVLGLNLTANPLNLTALKTHLPDFKDLIPNGQVRANLNVAGPLTMDRPWFDWPLQVRGSVNVNLPSYRLAGEAPSKSLPGAKSSAPTPPAKSTAEGFLPKGRLTQSARLQVDAKVGQFVKDSLVAQSVTVKGIYDGGKFQGTLHVQEVFQGDATLSGLDVPMLEPNPVVRGQAHWKGLNIEQALAFAKPEYKTMASGKASGQVGFATVLPSQADFMSRLQAQGQVQAQPVTLNSVKIGEIINEMIKKIPVLKVPPAKVEPLHGQMAMDFQLQSQSMRISRFEARDVDGSELQLKGSVALANMQGDLNGTFYWAKSPVKGCLAEGNSDGQGRLILPLAIKGDLKNPGFSLLTDLASKLAGKALDCEKNKFIERAKKEGGEKLKNEVNKALKGLFGH